MNSEASSARAGAAEIAANRARANRDRNIGRSITQRNFKASQIIGVATLGSEP
jgi:hypothetical protein